MSGMHSHDGVNFHASHGHSHDLPAADHGHTHEVLDGPGSYMGREMPIIEGRDWSERAFTVGIGGYVAPLARSKGSISLRAGLITCEDITLPPPYAIIDSNILMYGMSSKEHSLTVMQSRRVRKDGSDASRLPRTPREILHCSSDE
jgi:hypothetical protein